jgi:hypothetical protein
VRHAALTASLAALLLAGCGTTSLSGCIAGDGADAARAGAVVMMVPASGAFEKEWQVLLRGFEEEYRAARTAHDHARQAERDARSAERAASAASRKAWKARPGERYTVREDPQSGARVWTNQQPPPPVWPATQARVDATRNAAAAARRVNSVIDVHLGRAVAMIKEQHTSLANADAKGCYTVSRVPRERVYLLAVWGDRYAFRAVDAARPPERIDLSAGDSTWPFSKAGRVG